MNHVLEVVVFVSGVSFVGDNVSLCYSRVLSFIGRAWGKALAFAMCCIAFKSFCLYEGVMGNSRILLRRNP